LVFHYQPVEALIKAEFLFNLLAAEAYLHPGESVSMGITTRIFATISNTSGEIAWQERMFYKSNAGDWRELDTSMRRIDSVGS
jgi:hypothetical protein